MKAKVVVYMPRGKRPFYMFDTFGHLKVLEYIHPYKLLCECDCGKRREVYHSCLTTGVIDRCPDHNSARKGKYYTMSSRPRLYSHPLARMWQGMMNRCYNPNQATYTQYGAKGIRVDDRWHNFDLFVADMGERPSANHSLGRLDHTKNYGPSNVEWQTSMQQHESRRVAKNANLITIRGETMCLSKWATRYGLMWSTVKNRILAGWSKEKAVTTPLAHSKLITYKGKTQSISAWAAQLGLTRHDIYNRLRIGWSIERTLSEPTKRYE